MLIRLSLFGARAWMKQDGLKLFVQPMDALISYAVNCYKNVYVFFHFFFTVACIENEANIVTISSFTVFI